MNWPAAISLAVALPGLAAYSAFLGGILVALQARNAGLPWRVMVRAYSDLALIIEGLQVVALAGATSIFAAVAIFGVIHLQRRRDARRSTASPPSPAARIYRKLQQVARLVAIVMASIIAAAVSAAVGLRVLDWLGLVLPWGLRFGLIGIAIGLALWRTWPLQRGLRQRPVLLAMASGLALMGLSVFPLPWVAIFVVIGLASAMAFIWDLPKAPLRWSPYALLAGYVVLVGVAYAFALAATKPLALERVVLTNSQRVPFTQRMPDTHEMRTAGLVSLNGSNAVLAACVVELEAGKNQGYSADAVLFEASAHGITVTSDAYRFNRRGQVSLASLIGGDDLRSESVEPRLDICR